MAIIAQLFIDWGSSGSVYGAGESGEDYLAGFKALAKAANAKIVVVSGYTPTAIYFLGGVSAEEIGTVQWVDGHDKEAVIAALGGRPEYWPVAE